MKFTAQNIKRKLVVFKFTLNRGYNWCQLPTLATVGAGVIYPYVKQYADWIRFWELALFAIAVFILVGWIDKKFMLLHEEQNYVTETNPLLMKGLNLNNKKENLNNKKENINKIETKDI